MPRSPRWGRFHTKIAWKDPRRKTARQLPQGLSIGRRHLRDIKDPKQAPGSFSLTSSSVLAAISLRGPREGSKLLQPSPMKRRLEINIMATGRYVVNDHHGYRFALTPGSAEQAQSEEKKMRNGTNTQVALQKIRSCVR